MYIYVCAGDDKYKVRHPPTATTAFLDHWIRWPANRLPNSDTLLSILFVPCTHPSPMPGPVLFACRKFYCAPGWPQHQPSHHEWELWHGKSLKVGWGQQRQRHQRQPGRRRWWGIVLQRQPSRCRISMRQYMECIREPTKGNTLEVMINWPAFTVAQDRHLSENL